jgi:hypothetical protein
MKHRITGILLALSMLVPPLTPAVAATTFTEPSDININVGSYTLKIMQGSAYESLEVEGDSLTVTVPEGEGFEVRLAGPFPTRLDSGTYKDSCNVLTTRENQLFISGPRTITVTPNDNRCDTASAGNDDTPFVSFSVPNGSEELEIDDTLQLFWSTSGIQVPSVSLKLSTDGGHSFPTMITEDIINNGFYEWTVPELTGDIDARIKIEGFNGGEMVMMAVSPSFTINGLPEPEPVVEYVPAEQTSAASTISIDKGLEQVEPVPGFNTCTANTRIKPASSSAVYYCGVDSKRYVFPNKKTHDTWYSSFAGVVEISDESIAQIPLGGNVTYRPGMKLVKIQTDPKVYAVAAGGTLRWVTTEAVAERLYGAEWSEMVDDVPDAFFVNYTIGDPIE